MENKANQESIKRAEELLAEVRKAWKTTQDKARKLQTFLKDNANFETWSKAVCITDALWLVSSLTHVLEGDLFKQESEADHAADREVL